MTQSHTHTKGKVFSWQNISVDFLLVIGETKTKQTQQNNDNWTNWHRFGQRKSGVEWSEVESMGISEKL